MVGAVVGLPAKESAWKMRKKLSLKPEIRGVLGAGAQRSKVTGGLA